MPRTMTYRDESSEYNQGGTQEMMVSVRSEIHESTCLSLHPLNYVPTEITDH